MKKLSTLLTTAVLGCMGITAGVAHAGNYQPVNKGASVAQTTPANGVQKESKTAFFYDQCYTVPVCNGPVCTPIVRCNSYCSPCGPRPYFPASGGYGGYGNYGGYGGGYGAGYGGYGAGYGGYGVGGGYGGGYGVGGYGAGGYGGYGVGGYGSYGGYGAAINPGLAAPYAAPVMSNPGLGSPYLAPVNGGFNSPAYYPSNGFNGGFGAGISPISQPGFSSPVISTPIYSDPVYYSPFYP